MIPSTPQITINSRLGDIILEPMRMAKLKVFSDAVEPIISQIFTVLESDSDAKQNIIQMITKHYDELTFSYQHQTKTLVYKGSNTWKVVG